MYLQCPLPLLRYIIKNTIKNELRVISPLIRKSFDIEKSNEEIGRKICLLQTEISNLAKRPAPSTGQVSDELEASIVNLNKELEKLSAAPAPITHNNITEIHDDILKSIHYELEAIVNKKVELSLASQLADMAKAIESLKHSPSPPKAQDPASTYFAPPPPGAAPPASPYVHKSCAPYTDSVTDFLDNDMKLELQTFLQDNAEHFSKPHDANSRKLLYYGDFGYKYSNHSHQPKEIPSTIQNVITKISERFPNHIQPNSCLISLYENGTQSCPPHSDDEPFINPASEIFTLSIGATRSMQISETRGDLKHDIPLVDNSVLTFSRHSQNDWKHSILPDTSVTTARYSLTFRSIAPYNLHSTAIYGDSNTQELKFGTGAGTFGKWMPGKRVKTSKIKDIPTPDKIGPFRNIILSTGINDLSDMNCKPKLSLISEYEEKCKAIMSVYPKTKIFVSLILPTKDRYLNNLANDFNGCLINMAKKYANMFIINHDCLVANGFLDVSLGRYDKFGRPSDDTVHLGPAGYRRFVINIKDHVISKRKVNMSSNATSYKRPRPLGSSPALRSTLPHPAIDPSLAPPAFPHPSSQGQPGFPPRPLLPSGPLPPFSLLSSLPSSTLPPFSHLPRSSRRSFSGDYVGATKSKNYDLTLHSFNDGCQY